MTACTFDPTPLIGVPLGMFHCPDCGCMVLAGFEHGNCHEDCAYADDADRAAWERMYEELATQARREGEL